MRYYTEEKCQYMANDLENISYTNILTLETSCPFDIWGVYLPSVNVIHSLKVLTKSSECRSKKFLNVREVPNNLNGFAME